MSVTYFGVIECQFLSADDEVVGSDSMCLGRNTYLNLESRFVSSIQVKAIMFMEAKSGYCEWTVCEHFLLLKEGKKRSLDYFDVFVTGHVYIEHTK